MLSPQCSIPRALFVFAASVSATCFLLYGAADSLSLLTFSSSSSSSFSVVLDSINSNGNNDNDRIVDSSPSSLERVLKRAAMVSHDRSNKTVILTTLNAAWAEPNSVIDLFLYSFRTGDHTRGLLNHLVIVALDQKSYARCLQLHSHCFPLAAPGFDFEKEAYFMTSHYLHMMWTRIHFLCSVLEMGFNFVFTDADIMWFRNPFARFYSDADFQIACDNFLGSSEDMHNRPNGGFTYVKSNNRSIQFYHYWYSSRLAYPGYHDQDVFNFIKFDPFVEALELKIRFLDTAYFGGLCEPSRDFNLVCTMHANCCYGLDSKLHDLRLMLEDWKLYLSLPPSLKRLSIVSWSVPHNCSLATLRRNDDSQEEHKLQE